MTSQDKPSGSRRAGRVKRVGIVFAGGPAPGANAVIGAAAISFLDEGAEVVGFFHGYSNLQAYHPISHRLIADRHYRLLTERDCRGLRNSRGILLGTSRAGPGREVQRLEHLRDDQRTVRLRNVYSGLTDLGIDALVSIGGDGTLRTANLLYEYQKTLPADAPRVRVVHLPKTIDNDYRGIDFTFGFFTAVDFMAKELQNLRADALATSSYYIVETMGRKAGWLPYGVAIAGEANHVIACEDVGPELQSGGFLDPDKLADYLVDLIRTREQKFDKHYGTVVLAEGLAELFPDEVTRGVGRDDHGHLTLGKVDLAKMMAQRVAERYERKHGARKKITGVQIGYESRSAPPHAFDVMLGSQLGIGAWRALVEEGLDGYMVSCGGQLRLQYVPFAEVVSRETLTTEVRYMDPGSDYHRLARFLETRVDTEREWSPGRKEV